MDQVKVPGIELTLGGRKLVVPPLNFKSLKSLSSRLESFDSKPSVENMDLVADVLVMALRRNYTPEQLTREEVEEFLDVGNMLDVMEAAMDVGGLKRKALEDEKKEASGNPSTGTSSTAS